MKKNIKKVDRKVECPCEKQTASEVNTVSVRWTDGYLEEFQAEEVRIGVSFLWLRLTTGQERQIPLTQVRWTSQSIESHQRS